MTDTPAASCEQQLHDAAHAIPDTDTIDDIGDTEGQPDGITNDSHDLPMPANAASRIYEFLSWFGDGIVYGGEGDQPPLYARDLDEALTEPAPTAEQPSEWTPTVGERVTGRLDGTSTETTGRYVGPGAQPWLSILDVGRTARPQVVTSTLRPADAGKES